MSDKDSTAAEDTKLLMEELEPSDHQIITMDNKRQVYVHVNMLKIGDIDTIKENFEASVVIRSRWREPTLDKLPDQENEALRAVDYDELWNPKIFVDNVLGRPSANTTHKLRHTSDGRAYVLERILIQGKFFEALELWEFPFDVQDLTVHVMAGLDTDEVELIDDPDEFHNIIKQSFYDAQEWYLYQHVESKRSERARNMFDLGDTRHSLSVICKVARRPAFFLWNIFGVSLLICCLAFVTFAVKPELPQNRLQLSFVLVLTSVASKTAVNTYLPRISYLTYLDKHVLATIVMAATTCFWHGIQTLLPLEYHEYDWVALVVLASCYIIYLITFAVRVYRVPYKVRRTMKEREAEYIDKCGNRLKERKESDSPKSC